MPHENSNSGKHTSFSSTRSATKPNQIPAPKVTIKATSSTKRSVHGVSHISTSVRHTPKPPEPPRQKTPPRAHAEAEKCTAEKGVQIDDVEMMDDTYVTGHGDGPRVIFPSARILHEIERNNKIKKQLEMKARLNEKRKFEEHSAKQEIHLTNLKEFLDRGAITRKKVAAPPVENNVLIERAVMPSPDKTKTALEAYDRIKMKEEELLKMFNCV